MRTGETRTCCRTFGSGHVTTCFNDSSIFHPWRRHNYRWRASNLDLYAALMTIEQFFSVHTYCHLRGTKTLTPFGERLAVDLSLPLLRLRSVATGNTHPSSWKANALTDCATAADITILNYIYIICFIVDFRSARYQRHRHCWFKRSAKGLLGTYIWHLDKLGPLSWPAWMTLGLGLFGLIQRIAPI